MRTLQLLAIGGLLATAAWADGIPFYSYFYNCTLEREACGGPSQGSGPLRTFDLAAQPANGYFWTAVAQGEIPGGTNFPIMWEQISSNEEGFALGYLGSSYQDFLMGPTGQIYPAPFGPAGSINANGIFVSGGIDGPFLNDADAIEETGGIDPISLAGVMSPAIVSGVFDNYVANVVVIEGINDYNQVFVTAPVPGGFGMLSPFPVPEPSTLGLLAAALTALAWARSRHAA